MGAPPAGISEADWLTTPPTIRASILSHQLERHKLSNHLTALATELASITPRCSTKLASLREWIGRSSCNSSKPPSSHGHGFNPPERRKGRDRKRGGQPVHPGSGPEPLPIERVDEVVDHHPDTCRRYGMLLDGEKA